MTAASVFIPWAEVRAPFHPVSRAAYNGLETGDGKAAIAIGILAGLLGLVSLALSPLPSITLGVGSAVGAGVAGWVAWTNFRDIARFQAEITFRSGGDAYGFAGPGLWALASGAAITAIGAVLLVASRPAPRALPIAGGPVSPPLPWSEPRAAEAVEPAAPVSPPVSAAEQPTAVLCVNGHRMEPTHRFCPECGKERWT